MARKLHLPNGSVSEISGGYAPSGETRDVAWEMDALEGNVDQMAGDIAAGSVTTARDELGGASVIQRDARRIAGLANATLGYSTDSMATTVSEGDLIQVEDGAHFVVAASDAAAGEYGVTTTGGVKLLHVPRWTRTVFPADFGVKDSDGLTESQRRSAMQYAANRAASLGHELVIPQHSSRIEVDGAIRLTSHDGLTIHLDGEVHNTRTAPGDSLVCVFELGNHFPTNWALSGGNALTWYTAGSPSAGVDEITLDSGSNRTDGAAAIAIGDVVLIRSAAYRTGSPGSEHPAFMLAARVKDIDPSTGIVSIDRALPESVTDCRVANARSATVTDPLNSNTVYIPHGIKIVGPGKISSGRHPFLGTSCLDCIIDVGWVEGTRCVFGNLWSNTRFRVGTVVATEKLVDIAGASHDGTFWVGKAMLLGGGLSGDAAFQVAEASRDIRVEVDQILAAEYSQAVPFINLANSRRVKLTVETLIAPSALGPAASVVANDASGGGVVADVHDVTLDFGNVMMGTPSRFITGVDTAGTIKRARLARGTFSGSPTAVPGGATVVSAMNWQGTDNVIGASVRCEHGALEIGTSAVNLLVEQGAYFADGVSLLGGAKLSNHVIGGLRRASSALLRSSRYYNTVSSSSSTTSVGNVRNSIVIPPGAIEPDDEFHVVITGNIPSGSTNGAKNLRIADNTGTVATYSYASGDVGPFEIHVSMTNVTNTTATMIVAFHIHGKAVDTQVALRTGLDLLANGRTIHFQRWVGNASDAIETYTVRGWPVRDGYAV